MGGGKRRARRALERQLAYQRAKAERIRGHEPAVMADMAEQSAAVQAKLAAVGHIAAERERSRLAPARTD